MMRAKRQSRDHWTKVVDEFVASGMIQEEYGSKRSLNLPTFRAWIYRLRAAGTGKKKRFSSAESQIRMLPISVRDAPSWASGQIEITMGETVLRFPASTEAEYVGAILFELKTSC